MRTLQDRVAVVTGAASGIGRAVAEQLADKGCHLAIVDRDETGLASLAETIRGKGRRVSVHRVDVGDRDRLAALPDEVVGEHDQVHILVNNAGVALAGTLAENEVEDLDWIVDINFWGVVLGCKHFVPVLEQADEAHIVNISSLFGLIGLPAYGAYCATKAAVRSYSETLSAELRGSGITVTSVHPGGVKTNIIRNARLADESERSEAIESFEQFGITPERAANRIVHTIERGRTRLRIGWETYLADWIKRAVPVTTNRLVARVWTRQRARAAEEPTG